MTSDEQQKYIDQKYEEFCKNGQIEFVTFHPSFTYEDFVEGFRPVGNGNIQRVDGIFKEICIRALDEVMPEKETRLIDVFGEYKKKEFKAQFDPNNKKVVLEKKLVAPSTAASDVIEKEFGNRPSINGWTWWNVRNENGKETTIEDYDAKDMGGQNLFEQYYNMDKTARMALFKPESKRFVIVIDEINRANISKVFGELITLMEPNKRLGNDEELFVRLPYSKKRFGIPKNLFILGTMNSTDKSIALVDVALRRRFKFERMNPNYECIKNDESRDFLEKLNKKIIALKGEDFQIGHSYLMGDRGNQLEEVIREEILPLLEEYFYNDFDRLGTILGKDCIDRDKVELFEYDDENPQPTSNLQRYSRLKRDKITTLKEYVLGKTNPEVQPES